MPLASRLATTLLIALGLLLSAAAAGLGVSGLSSSGSAGTAQYGDTGGTPAAPRESVPAASPPVSADATCDFNGDGVVAADEDSNGSAAGCDESGDVLPTTSSPVPPDRCDPDGDGVISPTEAKRSGCGDDAEEEAARQVRRRRQVEAGVDVGGAGGSGGGEELPFTGFAALPLLAAGMAMLSSGVVLRRRTAFAA